MPSLLSFHDQQHITRMFVQEQRVNMIFNQFVSSIAPEMRKWKDAGNKNSVWVRNPGIEKAIDKYLVQLQSNLEKEIKSGQTKAWNEAVLKNDKMVESYIKGMSLSTIVKEGLFRRNLDALELLQNRTENGLNISQRVWNIADQTKGHVELFLEGGISTGRSADQISRDFRQLLQNPEKRFRRVRNKEGKLVMSKPMKDYHPGPGVYRSSKMNAIRVSATETNMGYRLSDSERWKQLDFVLGFEVKRSRNGHPCAICDALVGKYPKDFVFPGWHPFCICIAVPIVMEHEDFADFLLTDQIPENKYVKDIPGKAREWMDGYIKKTGSVPYFVKLNAKWPHDKNNPSILSKVQKGQEANKIADFGITSIIKPENERTLIQAKWDEQKLYNEIRKTEDEIRMNKKFETAVAFDTSGNIVLDKRGEASFVQLNGTDMDRLKDTVFTHNHPRGWGYPEKSLGRIGNSFSSQDIYTAIKANVQEMRAVTPHYTFSMKRPESGWGDINSVRNIIESENNKLSNEMWKGINSGIFKPERASAIHFHILWKRVSKKMNWNYSKSKT
jgi:hypothetical protein